MNAANMKAAGMNASNMNAANAKPADMKAAIIANGELRDLEFSRRLVKTCDYLIACDGGLRYFGMLNIVPDLIIGDMDSANLENYPDVPSLKFPVDKDQTDLELAIAHVCALEAEEIVILGGFGGRLDHMMGNIHILSQAVERDVRIEMLDESTRLKLIRDYCQIYKEDGILVTLLPFTSEVLVAFTDGLLYHLNNEKLHLGFARGVSNQVKEEVAEVRIESGMLLVIQTKI